MHQTEPNPQTPSPTLTPSDNLPRRVAINLLLWTFVCTLAATPSFVTAAGESFDQAGMIWGVVVFILAYTAVSSTPWAQRLKAQPAWRYTFYIGYGTRVAMSLLLFLPMLSDVSRHGWLAPLLGPAFTVDLLSGMLSVGLGQSLMKPFGLAIEGFTGTFVITLIQGAILNFILGLYMLIVLGILRVFIRKRYTGPWQCPRCGYDLRGSQQSPACPECGHANAWAGTAQT